MVQRDFLALFVPRATSISLGFGRMQGFPFEICSIELSLLRDYT
jgi:hypothetical protein